LGFEESQIDELISILNSNSYVLVKSILSHLATSDDLKQRDFVLNQISLFEKISSRLISELNIAPIRHILNTSGISNYSQHQYDMVRLGIGLYGISGNIQEQNHLEQVGTLKSVISQIRTIPKGDSVGYGRRFIAERETRVATIPIGYADGIRRMWGSNGGYVTIQKQKAPIIGSICMDMLMVDVTDIPCVEGNQAIIFGSLPSVFEIAEALQTIPYEILTGISHRVKRIFYRE
ncbi:MAG TPA: alanine racemase, partial [Flavobacterium sp.]|nr:alanine racemase [Flavobacterium sp.]